MWVTEHPKDMCTSNTILRPNQHDTVSKSCTFWIHHYHNIMSSSHAGMGWVIYPIDLYTVSMYSISYGMGQPQAKEYLLWIPHRGIKPGTLWLPNELHNHSTVLCLNCSNTHKKIYSTIKDNSLACNGLIISVSEILHCIQMKKSKTPQAYWFIRDPNVLMNYTV